MIPVFIKKSLFLIFINFIISVFSAPDPPKFREKEIDTETGEDTIIYKDTIQYASDEIRFAFNTDKKTTIKFELLNEEDSNGEGTFKILKDLSPLLEERIKNGKGYTKSYTYNSNGEKQKLRISYKYPKRHTVLIKIYFLDAIFLKMKYNENSPSLLNIFSLSSEVYYLNISLSNLERKRNFYIKGTKENLFRIDEALCLDEQGLENLRSKDIIDKFNNNKKYCKIYQTNSNSVFTITNLKDNNDYLFIRLKISNDGIGKLNMFLNLFKEDILDFKNSEKYPRRISKYEGIYLTLDLNTLGDNNEYLMYTNVTKSMNVYGFTKEDKNDYKYDLFEDGYPFDYKNILHINSSLIEAKSLEYIVFANKNLEEDFSFFLLKINKSEASMIESTFPVDKPEKITFRAFSDENGTSIRYIIVNSNDELKRKRENYFYFFEEIFGSIKAKIYDLDKNLEMKETENIYDPQIIPEDNTVFIELYKKGNYKYKMYSLICSNQNRKVVEFGQNFQICLRAGEVTSLYLPKGLINYEEKLLIDKESKENYNIEINYSNKDKKFLTNKNRIIYNSHISETSEPLTFTNNGKSAAIINFKISIDDTSNVEFIRNSIDRTILRNDKYYALLFPTESDIGKIYGVYQELEIKGKNRIICIDFSQINNGIISYPPNEACLNFDNSVYFENDDGNKKFNLNLTLGSDNNDNDSAYYTFIYLKDAVEGSVLLNYKQMVIYNEGIKETYDKDDINIISESKDICYINLLKNSNTRSINYLFLQAIKKELKQSDIQINSQFLNKNNDTSFKIIENIKFENLKYITSSIIELKEHSESDIYIKLTSPQNLFIFFTYSDYFYFTEIEENIIPYDYNLGKQKYILNFKPVDQMGEANYYLFFIEEGKDSATLEQLSNPYYLISSRNESFKIVSAHSNKGEFSLDVKNEFKFNLSEISEGNHFIALLGQRLDPLSYKFYIPIFTKEIEPTIKTIKMSEITKKFNFSLDIEFTENEAELIVHMEENVNNGALIIQSASNKKSVNQTIYIAKGKIDDRSEILQYIFNFNNILLNLSNHYENFDIKFFFQKTESKGKLLQKVYFNFIPFENDYLSEGSGSEYGIVTDVKIPYYLRSDYNLEILKLQIDNKDILKINGISIKIFSAEKLVLEEEKKVENLIKFSDNEYYLEYFYKENKYQRTFYFEIDMGVNEANYNNEKVLSLSVDRIKANDLAVSQSLIQVSNYPQFYYLDLKYVPNENGLLLFSQSLNNAVKFHLGIYCVLDEMQKMKEIFQYISYKELRTKNFIVFILQDNSKYNGYLDFKNFKDDEIIINYNESRDKFYAREDDPLILNGTGYKYFINFNETAENEKYHFTYEVNKTSYSVSGSTNKITLSYFNDFSFINDKKKKHLHQILEDSKKNVIDRYKKLEGKTEILYLEYDVMDGPVLVTLKAENYDYIKGRGNEGIIFSLSFLFSLLLITGGVFICKSLKNNFNYSENINKNINLIDGKIIE